jgi:hypothetical protein
MLWVGGGWCGEVRGGVTNRSAGSLFVFLAHEQEEESREQRAEEEIQEQRRR